MKREKRYNQHHWLPKSRGGATNDFNCEMIRVPTHDAIHTLFSNDIFPEQLARLTDLTSKVLQPEIVKELYELLSYRDIHNPEERYKEWAILLPKHYKEWKKN